ncbi:MAG TPA: YihY/virulence factor BrkB family protein [Gemmataceae bacterium]|nr:YihY/virulence factor BrkB family protein [Gemmataceae bacterium]
MFMTSMRIIYRAILNWNADGGTRMGAALAYYTLFSIAPLLLIAVYLSGSIFGADAAEGKVHEQLESIMGTDVAGQVESFLKVANRQQQETFWTPIISVIFLVAGALGGFLHVRTSLCTIWRIEPPHGNTWLGILLDYALAVAMVFVIATLLLLSLLASLVSPLLQRLLRETRVPMDETWHWVEVGASFVFITVLFALSYRILSGGRIAWGYVWYGAMIASILFTIGKILVSYYIIYSGAASMYGAGGSIVVFLMWVYYSSQTLFFGAELIQARRTRHDRLE